LLPAKDIQPDYDGDELPMMIETLDNAINKFKTPGEFIVYTSLSGDYNIDEFSAGQTFQFKGFRSTTINSDIALNYNSRPDMNNKKTSLLLQIKVTKGSKGVYVDDISSTPGENEFLLPRGSKVKILGGPNKMFATNDKTGPAGHEIYYLDCELLKQK